jgi:PAS domain S-box-containing protein
MSFLSAAFSTEAWLAAALAVAALGVATTVILLRDHMRLERHAASLEAEARRLRDEVGEQAGTGARLTAMLEALADPVVMTDAAGFVLYANESFAALAGRPSGTLVGSRDVLWPTHRRPAQRLPGGRTLVEEGFERPGGESWIAWADTPVKTGAATATLRVGRDVTSYMRRIRTMEAAAFTAGSLSAPRRPLDDARHREIRTLVSGMIGLTELVLETELTADQADHLQSAKEFGESLLSAIPRPRAVPEASAAAPARQAPPAGPVKRVLLAEDDDANALLALTSLEATKAKIDWAKDGREALSLVERSFSDERPYDLILMDMRMPKLDGLEVTERIRALETSLRRTDPVRIVAVTATTMKRDRAAAARAGVDGFLSKPYLSDALLKLVAPAASSLPRAS